VLFPLPFSAKDFFSSFCLPPPLEPQLIHSVPTLRHYLASLNPSNDHVSPWLRVIDAILLVRIIPHRHSCCFTQFLSTPPQYSFMSEAKNPFLLFLLRRTSHYLCFLFLPQGSPPPFRFCNPKTTQIFCSLFLFCPSSRTSFPPATPPIRSITATRMIFLFTRRVFPPPFSLLLRFHLIHDFVQMRSTLWFHARSFPPPRRLA